VLVTVLMVPMVLFAVLAVVQYGLAYHARQVLAGATQDGAAAGARRTSSAAAGAGLADSLIEGSAGQLLSSHTSAASSDGTRVTVRSTGRVVRVLPFFPSITVAASASATVERFEPQGAP
jgi:Flp pilus assembly protein TadG